MLDGTEFITKILTTQVNANPFLLKLFRSQVVGDTFWSHFQLQYKYISWYVCVYFSLANLATYYYGVVFYNFDHFYYTY